MHPYTSNLLVDVVPSVFNTNPLSGRGGYEKNLASFNGTRPLATTLDEKQEIAQRVYEDEFKMSANNPLSMQYTLNHADVQKNARGEMYDAFRLGVDRYNADDPMTLAPEPDYETVLKSKVEKGYNTKGYLPKSNNEDTISQYFENQKPARRGDIKQGVNRINEQMVGIAESILPAPHADMAVQVGHDRNDVVGGGPNFFGRGGGGWGGGDDDDSSGGGGSGAARNQIEIMHDLSDFGHLRSPRISEDLFSFDTSRPERAGRHPYHNDDISSHAAGMDEISFLTDDSSSYKSTPALSEAELMSVLGPPSTNSSESKRLHNLRRAARTTPRVNHLLEGTSAHVDYTLASGGYGVQASDRSTSLQRLDVMNNLRRDFATPSSNRNLGHDFSAESISPWSYNNVIRRIAPEPDWAPTRPKYLPDGDMNGAGEILQFNQPSMQQMPANANIKIIKRVQL
jgi:hypothetical protein